MSLRSNIKRVKKQMLNEVGETQKPVSDKVQQLALRAIIGGLGTEASWEEYMELFVDPGGNQVQLDRLMAKDATGADDEMNSARAYLVADGTCGTDTVTNFGLAASDLLDLGLPTP